MDVIQPPEGDSYDELKAQWWQDGPVVWTLGDLRGIVYAEKLVISKWVSGMVLDPNVKDIVVYAACTRHASMYASACFKELAGLEDVTIVVSNPECIQTKCGTTISFYPIRIGRLPEMRGISADRVIIVNVYFTHYPVPTHWFETRVAPLFQLKECKVVVMTE